VAIFIIPIIIGIDAENEVVARIKLSYKALHRQFFADAVSGSAFILFFRYRYVLF
jgi:hypothetical protein